MKIYSQNLVPNCDFDVYYSCPTSHGQLGNARHWIAPTSGTSDLCHTCAGDVVGIPNNMWGSQAAYSGNGYGHIICFYDFVSPQYREYMQAELACPLRAGEQYRVSFFVSCTDNSGFGIDGMGLFFSKVPINQPNSLVIDLGEEPSVSHPPGQPITKQDGWTEIQGIYLAGGGEKFITIGNFIRDENLTRFDFPGSSSSYASYYVGHISVTPVSPWLDLGGDTVICPGESYHVDASIGCTGRFLWNDGDTGATRIFTAPGTYTVEVSMGCGSISDDLRIDWHPKPVTPVPRDTFICRGESVYLDAGNGFSSYLWQDGSRDQFYVAGQPGLCWVEVEDGHGCLCRDSVMVYQLSEPIVSLGTDRELCTGDSIRLEAGNQDKYTTYLWQDLSVSENYLVRKPGTYWVNVTNPCESSSDTVNVTYKTCETELWVPNAFRPDDNGLNTEFKVKGANIASFRLFIYNRWGELLFEAGDMEEGWDGTRSGIPCPGDIYVWIIRYKGMTDTHENARLQKGTVLLLR